MVKSVSQNFRNATIEKNAQTDLMKTIAVSFHFILPYDLSKWLQLKSKKQLNNIITWFILIFQQFK